MPPKSKKNKVLTDSNEIVVRRTKKTGHKAHGGMWKVAYADFVTAMMVFFLVMWIISIIPKEDISEVVDYFAKNNSPVPTYASPQEISLIENQENVISRRQTQHLHRIQQAFQRTNFTENVIVRISAEGHIIISFQDTDDNRMFTSSTALTLFGQEALSYTAKLLNTLQHHQIVVSANDPVFAGNYTGVDDSLRRWELTVDRAHNSAAHMIKYGMSMNKITSIEALSLVNYQYSGLEAYRDTVLQLIVMSQEQSSKFLRSKF